MKKIEASEIEILRRSAKGAALIKFNFVEMWIKPVQAKSLEAGRVTPAVSEELIRLDNRSDKAEKHGVNDCAAISIEKIEAETDKAIYARIETDDYRGRYGTKTRWIPKSCIIKKTACPDNDENYFFVKIWWLNNNRDLKNCLSAALHIAEQYPQ